MKRFKFLAHKMSQNMDSGTGSSYSSDGSQMSKYTCMLEVEDHQLAISDASDTMNVWNNRVNIYDKLSLIAQDILAAPASQAYAEKVFFCVRPAYCWSQKQKFANASLFETEQQSIGEHRHQYLCVNFGTLTLIEMNCK